MKKITGYLAIIAISVLCSCGNEEHKTTETAKPPAYDKLAKVNWLIGTWKCISPEGTVYEVWNKASDSVYTGKSYFAKGKDTIPLETMKLQQNGEDVYFIPTVNGQNSGQPVSFAMTSAAGDNLVFENPTHDFPQKIVYNKAGTDSIFAAISGSIKGAMHTEQFPMSRVK